MEKKTQRKILENQIKWFNVVKMNRLNDKIEEGYEGFDDMLNFKDMAFNMFCKSDKAQLDMNLVTKTDLIDISNLAMFLYNLKIQEENGKSGG